MRETSAVWRLSFILSSKLYAVVPRGPQAPCLFGCLLTVHGAGLVSVEGRPLDVVLEQARRFLRGHRLGSIAATLWQIDGDCTPQRGLLLAGRSVTFSAMAQLELPGVTDAA